MGEALEQLKEVWPLVMTAPWGFAGLAAFLLLSAWAFGRFAFGERIANLRSRIESKDERIAVLEARLLEVVSPPAQPVAPKATAEPVREIRSAKISPLSVERMDKPQPLRTMLVTGKWTLHFSPGGAGGRKPISFLPDGLVGEGRNNNEHAWAIEGAAGEYLTIYRMNGDVQNVFYLSDKTGRLEYMPDRRAKGLRDQFIDPR